MAKGLRMMMAEIPVDIVNLPPKHGTDLCRQEVVPDFHTLDKVTSGTEKGRTVDPPQALGGMVDPPLDPTV